MNASLETARPESSPSAAVAFLTDLISRISTRVELGDEPAEILARILPIYHDQYAAVTGLDAVVQSNDEAHDWFADNVRATLTDEGPNDNYDADRERYVAAGRCHGARLERETFSLVFATDEETPSGFRIAVAIPDHPAEAAAVVYLTADKIERIGRVCVVTYTASIDEIA